MLPAKIRNFKMAVCSCCLESEHFRLLRPFGTMSGKGGFFTGKGSNMVPTQQMVATRLPWALAMPEAGRRLQLQKSVLVHSPIGFVEPDHVINIPSTLKDALLRYLDKYHDIKATAMYSDLHGFIRYRRSHRSHSAEFFAGQEAGTAGFYDLAIEHFTVGLELIEENIAHDDAWRSQMSSTILQVRGLTHVLNKTFRLAVEDLTGSLRLGQEISRVYWHRALAYMGLQEWTQAQEDLTQKGVTTNFRKDYRNIAELEADLGVKVPSTIAECLMRSDTRGSN